MTLCPIGAESKNRTCMACSSDTCHDQLDYLSESYEMRQATLISACTHLCQQFYYQKSNSN